MFRLSLKGQSSSKGAWDKAQGGWGKAQRCPRKLPLWGFAALSHQPPRSLFPASGKPARVSRDLYVAAAVVLTIVIGVGVWPLRCQGGEARPRPHSAAAMPPRDVKRRVAVRSNDPCYVCHMPFIEEPLSVVHAKVAVWCGTCHGPSMAHVEDENIGATPADVGFKKDQVDRMCSGCHDPQEHRPLTQQTRRQRLAEGQKAQRQIKRSKIKATGLCTDCHGHHWIPPRDRPSKPPKILRKSE